MLARLILTAIPLAVSSAGQDGFEAGSAAPPGRWTTSGGCAARTGRSLSAPLRLEPEVAWQVTVRGEIESEPLVWNGTVIVAVREASSRRSVHVLELETGRTLLHQVLPAGIPLEPAVWGDLIAVRPAENRVDVYRQRGQRLLLLRTIRAKESISSPLFFEEELYLRVDDELARFDLNQREPVWSARVDGVFRGCPSLRGDGVYGPVFPARAFTALRMATRTFGHGSPN